MSTRSRYRTRANKGRSYYSKNIFWTYTPWCIWPNFVYEYLVEIDEIDLNAPILGRFKGCGYNSRATFNVACTVDSTTHKGLNFFFVESVLD